MIGTGTTATEAAGVFAIGWPQLALATLLVIFVGALSWRLTLGLEKDLAIATVRTYVQLFLLGFVLTWVFARDSWPIVIGIMLVMIAMASYTIIRRAPDAPAGILASSFFSMVVTGFSVTFIVTGLIIQVEPWYAPRYVIPIAGMVLGNSMTGIALALERTYSDLDARSGQILALTALGATPWEAGYESVRTGIRAGLTPTIASMATVGVVFIPGMMTGQIIAGADPVAASTYQIVVMLMVSSATALGAVLSVLLSFRKRFTSDGVYLERGLRDAAE